MSEQTDESVQEEGVVETPPTEVTETPELETETEEITEEMITLPSGEQVSSEELMNGYLRQSDYTKKTQELADNRKKVEEMIGKLGQGGAKEEPKGTPKPKYNPEQLNELKGILGELGYVSKEELNQMNSTKTQTQITNSFMETHPEYKQENDPGDIKYKELKKELSFYNTSDLSKLPKVLERAHAKVKERFDASSEAGKKLAGQEKSKAASIGSGGGGAPAPSVRKTNLTEAQIKIMKEVGVWDAEKHA